VPPCEVTSYMNCRHTGGGSKYKADAMLRPEGPANNRIPLWYIPLRYCLLIVDINKRNKPARAFAALNFGGVHVWRDATQLIAVGLGGFAQSPAVR
jgi:hypothetical protein